MEEWAKEQAEAEESDASPIRPQRLCAAIGRHKQPGTIFVCDTGAVTLWAARHLRLDRGDRFTLSASLASMGFGLPGAIGAQLAYPEEKVVALVGDGGFTMLIGDLITAVDLGLPITVVVFNNSRLGLIQMEQEAEGLPQHAVDLANPDFGEVARAMGAVGFHVESPFDLDDALAQAFASDRPAVVDVVIDPEEITMPPVVDPPFAFQYAKAKALEVLTGEVGALAGVKAAVRQVAERLTN
jgi:thiamine pyrophosphate-dependent acetolactate synthase large subunit-like protein